LTLAMPASLYERLAGAEDARVLVFGHTDNPWIDSYGGVMVRQLRVGRGTQGWRSRTAFALLELDTG
jgi:hypothetical protein